MQGERVWLALLAALAAASLVLGVLRGSSALPVDTVLAALTGGGDDISRQIVWGLRAPRVLAAFACGGLLALAGLAMQALTRNLMADPYVLGASGGASVAGLSAALAGAGWAGMHLAAFAGALAAMVLVLGLTFRPRDWRADHLLLAGIAVSSAGGAVVTLLLAMAPAGDLRGLLFWLMGDLSHAQSPWPAAVTLLGVTGLAVALGSRLDVLALGDLKARSLGVDVRQVKLALFVLAALATAMAVLTAGTVGFVGLVVPHLLRLAGLTRHRGLALGVALAGGALLTLADLLARSLIAPQQLPVGALTALIGVPLLIALLRRHAAP